MPKELDLNKKSGYLNENFRLFHLKDKKKQEFEPHYHDFHKIVVFLSGNVTYSIEGKNYRLLPYDILLVSRHCLHRPFIDKGSTYERIVIWIKNEFLDGSSFSMGCDIASCFALAADLNYHLIRLPGDAPSLLELKILMNKMEEALHSEEFAASLLGTTYFLQALISLNRIFLAQDCQADVPSVEYDPQIQVLLQYINTHLEEDLSNDILAKRFYLSRYHLMHKFKKETGDTLHHYIEQKRLIQAGLLLKEGTPVSKTASLCGFHEYSTFLRAFRKKYAVSPREYQERLLP